MRIKDLLESPTFDRIQRLSAREKLNLVINEINLNGYDNFKYMTNPMPLYAKNFGTFTVVFAEGKDGDGGFSKESNAVWLYTKDFKNPKKAIRNSKVLTAFIHEAIHLQDSHRFTKMVSPPDPKVDPDGYYNNHAEMNAYYQEAIDKLEQTVERYPQLIQKFQDFNYFTMSMNTLFNQGYMKNLSEQNKRSLIKRLYKHFDEYIRGK